MNTMLRFMVAGWLMIAFDRGASALTGLHEGTWLTALVIAAATYAVLRWRGGELFV